MDIQILPVKNPLEPVSILYKAGKPFAMGIRSGL